MRRRGSDGGIHWSGDGGGTRAELHGLLADGDPRAASGGGAGVARLPVSGGDAGVAAAGTGAAAAGGGNRRRQQGSWPLGHDRKPRTAVGRGV
uniref:DUF834 domain-containing protein n=1 Tax=Oryza nivara TaxID=4536 RepID=A0A0E0GPE9_ORYNI